MPRLVLVRHGRPAAGYGDHVDPGLAPEGRAQAVRMADALDAAGGARPIVVSPMRRARQTAAPLEARWRRAARMEDAVGEIATPRSVGDDLGARRSWLREVLRGSWRQADDELLVWRRRLLTALTAVSEDTVVVTHFVAINAAVGFATDDDRLVCFSPGHCSCTEVEIVDGCLRVVSVGAGAVTDVR